MSKEILPSVTSFDLPRVLATHHIATHPSTLSITFATPPPYRTISPHKSRSIYCVSLCNIVNCCFADENNGKLQFKSTTITPLIHHRSPHVPPTASDHAPQYSSYANSPPHNRHRNFLFHHHDLSSHGRLLHIHLDNTQNARIPFTLHNPRSLYFQHDWGFKITGYQRNQTVVGGVGCGDGGSGCDGAYNRE